MTNLVKRNEIENSWLIGNVAINHVSIFKNCNDRTSDSFRMPLLDGIHNLNIGEQGIKNIPTKLTFVVADWLVFKVGWYHILPNAEGLLLLIGGSPSKRVKSL